MVRKSRIRARRDESAEQEAHLEMSMQQNEDSSGSYEAVVEKTLECESAEKEEQLEVIKKKKGDLVSSYDADKITILEREAAEKEEQLNMLKKQNEELSGNYHAAVEKIATLEHESVEKEKQLQMTKKDNEELSVNYYAVMDKIRMLERDSVEKEEQLEMMKKENMELSENYRVAADKIATLERESAEKEEQLEMKKKENAELSNKYQEVVDKVAVLERESAEKEEQLDMLKKQSEETSDKYNAAVDKVAVLERQLQESLEKQEQLNKELETINENHAKSQSSLEKKLKENLVTAVSKIKDLKLERSEIEASKKELCEKLDVAQMKLVMYETEVAEYTKDSEQQVKGIETDYQHALEKIATLEKELYASLEKQEELNVHLVAKDIEIAEIAKELEKMASIPPKVVTDDDAIKSLKETLRNINIEFSQVTKKKEHLKAEVQQFTEQVQAQKDTIKALETFRDDLLTKYAGIEEERQQLLTVIEQLKASQSCNKGQCGSISLFDKLVVIRQAFFKLVLDENHKYDHYRLLINLLDYDEKSSAILREYVEAMFTNKLDHFWKKFDYASLVQKFLNYVEMDILTSTAEQPTPLEKPVDKTKAPTISEVDDDILKLIMGRP